MKKMAKRIMTMLCAIAIMLSVLALPGITLNARAAEGLDLSKMQIVLAANATAVEATAALELRDYLYKMTGVTLKTVTEGENSGAGIYLGNTKYAKSMGVTYPTEGDTKGEGWAIKAVDGNLILIGAEQRGTIYAVYHLLEDVLGFRQWTLWETYVPEGPAIVPDDYADSGVPYMEFREVFVGTENNTDYPFYVFNRINGYTTHIPAPYGNNEVYGGPSHVHNFNKYFTQEDFEAHPEWFSMDENGQRVSNRQLCLTNPELQKEFANRLINYVKKAPEGLFAICPNDNKYLCDCSECKKEIEAYAGSGYVLNFVNKMARAVVAAGYTEASIEMLVYWAYVEVPREIVPEPNVLLRIANNDIDILHGINHPCNEDILERTKQWAKLGSNGLYYWQYVLNYYNNGIVPSMMYYGDDFTTLAEMGINGWFAEQENSINADFWDMKTWLIAKLMEKPVKGEEYEALMDEFIFGYYGEEPGQYIREYLYYMYEKSEAADVRQTFSTTIIGAEWLTVEDIIRGCELFDKAFEAAGRDELLLRRLRRARSGFDRVAYENYSRWQEEAENAGLTLPFTKRELGERICYTFTEQIALRGNYDNGFEKISSLYDYYTDELPELPEELAGMEREHVIEYSGVDFQVSGKNEAVPDTDSPVGTAVRMNSASILDVTLYNTHGGQNTEEPIGVINSADIVDGSGYQLYKLDYTVPAIGANSYVRINDAKYKIPLLASHMQEMEGQKVEIYLSMKTEDKIFYIDRVLLVPEGYSEPHSYVIREKDGMGVCKICGDVEEGVGVLPSEDTGKTQNKNQNQNGLLILIIALFVIVDIAVAVVLIVVLKKKKS